MIIYIFDFIIQQNFLGMYSGIMSAEFLIGDFDDAGSPFCDSVALLQDFLTNDQMAERLPSHAASAEANDEW